MSNRDTPTLTPSFKHRNSFSTLHSYPQSLQNGHIGNLVSVKVLRLVTFWSSPYFTKSHAHTLNDQAMLRTSQMLQVTF